jgi:hypothetical protein
MDKYANLQKTEIGKVETFDIQSMINKALIGILISKGIISEDELAIIFGNINRQQENYLKKQGK